MESQLIRKMTNEDLEMVLTWRNRPEIRRSMYTQHEISLDEHKNWFQNLDETKNQCLICEKDGKPIGVVNFSNLNNGPTQVIWGFYSGDLNTKGLGIVIGKLALDYAFNDLKLEKLNGEVLGNNLASLNFHKKLGFKQEGQFKNHFILPNGEHVDIFRLAIFKNEWEQQKLSL